MLKKYVVTGLAGSLLLASAAFAQTPTATTDRSDAAAAPAAVSQSSFQGNWRASKVAGLNVYNDNNENVGSINDLLMDKSGAIKAAVISVGGFLGVGAHLVAVPFDKIIDRQSTGHDIVQHVEIEHLVSRPRRVQYDQGRAEGDAGIQVRVSVTAQAD
jgi:sporulation protein YlmC with PRC-barrel domain